MKLYFDREKLSKSYYFTSFFSEILSAVVSALITFFLGLFAENRWGLKRKLNKYWHKIKNSSLKFRIIIHYNTDVEKFDKLKDTIREKYSGKHSLRIYENSDNEIRFSVDNEYIITIGKAVGGGINFETNEINSTIRNYEKKIHMVLNPLRSAEEEITEETKFEGDEFTAHIYLPYESNFLSTHLPENTTIEKRKVNLKHENYDCEIEIKSKYLSFHSGHRNDLEKTISAVI